MTCTENGVRETGWFNRSGQAAGYGSRRRFWRLKGTGKFAALCPPLFAAGWDKPPAAFTDAVMLGLPNAPSHKKSRL
ncbi:MAG: hypothetical protein AB1767_13855 [Bacillota bacterium]